MKIFVSHSSNFDFKNELYRPLRESDLSKKHEFFFPHDTDIIFNTKEAIQNVYDMVLAEVSFPSTGMGIEMGWANDAKKKILCIYKKGSKYSSSLNEVSENFMEYTDNKDLIDKLKSNLDSFI